MLIAAPCSPAVGSRTPSLARERNKLRATVCWKFDSSMTTSKSPSLNRFRRIARLISLVKAEPSAYMEITSRHGFRRRELSGSSSPCYRTRPRVAVQ